MSKKGEYSLIILGSGYFKWMPETFQSWKEDVYFLFMFSGKRKTILK